MRALTAGWGTVPAFHPSMLHADRALNSGAFFWWAFLDRLVYIDTDARTMCGTFGTSVSTRLGPLAQPCLAFVALVRSLDPTTSRFRATLKPKLRSELAPD